VKTSPKRSYSVIENERFGLVFAKISGTDNEHYRTDASSLYTISLHFYLYRRDDFDINGFISQVTKINLRHSIICVLPVVQIRLFRVEVDCQYCQSADLPYYTVERNFAPYRKEDAGREWWSVAISNISSMAWQTYLPSGDWNIFSFSTIFTYSINCSVCSTLIHFLSQSTRPLLYCRLWGGSINIWLASSSVGTRLMTLSR
jgi:hypothetical protein